MTVYVDPLKTTPLNSNWPYVESCHLTADSEAELHAFAAAIGMKREWFQRHHLMPHYDLTSNKRSAAVRHGAVEITRRQSYERIKARRLENKAP